MFALTPSDPNLRRFKNSEKAMLGCTVVNLLPVVAPAALLHCFPTVLRPCRIVGRATRLLCFHVSRTHCDLGSLWLRETEGKEEKRFILPLRSAQC